MRHIAAYLLLVLGGNESPSAEDVTKLLSSVGIDADADRVGKLVGALEGKELEALIAEGMAKLQKVPTGGGAVVAAGAAAAGAAEAEAPEEEEEEEEEVQGNVGGLFGDDEDGGDGY